MAKSDPNDNNICYVFPFLVCKQEYNEGIIFWICLETGHLWPYEATIEDCRRQVMQHVESEYKTPTKTERVLKKAKVEQSSAALKYELRGLKMPKDFMENIPGGISTVADLPENIKDELAGLLKLNPVDDSIQNAAEVVLNDLTRLCEKNELVTEYEPAEIEIKTLRIQIEGRVFFINKPRGRTFFVYGPGDATTVHIRVGGRLRRARLCDHMT